MLACSGKFSRVYAASRNGRVACQDFVTPLAVDILDENSLATAALAIGLDGELDLLIVATGLLHSADGIKPEKSFRQLDAAAMADIFAVNTIGPALIAKHLLPLLATKRRAAAIFLSARVGSIGDNRLGGWHSYRASKAALNALTRCFAIEVSRRNPAAVVAALHPGTVDTPLSKPFQARVLSTSLFSADVSAAHIISVIDRLKPEDNGGFFGWDGRPIQF